MKMSSRRAAIAILFVLTIMCAARLPADTSLQGQPSTNEDLVTVELSAVGVDQVAGSPVVLLRDPESGKVLPIWVGAPEARAIALALHGIAMPRPMTHDLMANLLAELHAKVEDIIVDDFRSNTYFGRIRLRVAGEKKTRDVDSRPSDALALAVRTGAPIRVARKVLATASPFDFSAEGPNPIVQALGITVIPATPALRKEFQLGDQPGVLVTSVIGRAAELGLRRGDLIVEINGEGIADPMEFFDAIQAAPAGRRIQLIYWREHEEKALDLPADMRRERRPGEKPLTI